MVAPEHTGRRALSPQDVSLVPQAVIAKFALLQAFPELGGVEQAQQAKAAAATASASASAEASAADDQPTYEGKVRPCRPSAARRVPRSPTGAPTAAAPATVFACVDRPRHSSRHAPPCHLSLHHSSGAHP